MGRSEAEERGGEHGEHEHRHLIQAVEQVLQHRLTEHLAEVEHRMAGHLREAVISGRRQVDHAVDVCTPAWLLPCLEAAILLLLVVANPRRIDQRRRWIRVLGLVPVAVATLANIYSAAQLVWRLVHGVSLATVALVIARAVNVFK